MTGGGETMTDDRALDRDRSLDIAVTGMSGRFPGAPDIASLWRSVLNGEVLTTRFGAEELAAAGVPDHLSTAPGYVPVHGALADPHRFEYELFGISPREAELMDPQHRLMLEAAWAALEDAAARRTPPDRPQVCTRPPAAAATSAPCSPPARWTTPASSRRCGPTSPTTWPPVSPTGSV